jgi:beta-lactamase regulating signal transducer with metallopeptidase domain
MSISDCFIALDQWGFSAARFMLSVLWQSSLLFIATLAISAMLKSRRAKVRHALWALALLTTPLLPFFTSGAKHVGAPQAPVSILPVYIEPMIDYATDVRLAPEEITLPLAVGRETPTLAPTPLNYPWAFALLAYAIGVVTLLIWFCMGRVQIKRWIRSAMPSTDQRVLEAFRDARKALRMKRSCLVLESDNVPTPLSVGIIRSKIILPTGLAARLSNEQLQAIALHETAHLRRRDPLMLTLVALVRALLFFHPLVWLAARQISTLTEHCADDAVLDNTGQPLPYAQLLTQLAENLPSRSLSTEMATGLLFTRGAFLARVEAVLSDRARIKRLSRLALLSTVFAGLFSLAVAMAMPLGERGAGDKNELKSSEEFTQAVEDWQKWQTPYHKYWSDTSPDIKTIAQSGLPIDHGRLVIPPRKNNKPVIPGYGEAWAQQYVAAAPKPCKLTGVVHDQDGNRVGGAIIQAILRFHVTYNVATDYRVRPLQCDAEGRYTFDALPEGPYRLIALKPDYMGKKSIVITLNSGKNVQDLDIQINNTISGIVVNSTGAPIEGVTIRIHAYSPVHHPNNSFTNSTLLTRKIMATSDKQGQFSFDVERTAIYHLRFLPRGYARQIVYDVLPGAAPTRVTLSDGATIEGRVVGTVNGKTVPVPGISVRIACDGSCYSYLPRRKTVTDEEGQFCFEHVRAQKRPEWPDTHYVRREWTIKCGNQEQPITVWDGKVRQGIEFVLPEMPKTLPKLPAGKSATTSKRIKIDMKIGEMPPSALPFDATGDYTVLDHKQVSDLLSAIANEGKLLANPRIAILDGKRGSIEIQEKPEYLAEDEFLGMRMEVIPLIMDDETIQLDIAYKTSVLVGFASPEKKSPILDVKTLKRIVEMERDRTAMISVPPSSATSTMSARFLLITPSVVETTMLEIEATIMEASREELFNTSLFSPFKKPKTPFKMLNQKEWAAHMSLFDTLDSAEVLSLPRIVTLSQPSRTPRIEVTTRLPYLTSIYVDESGKLQYDYEIIPIGIVMSATPVLLNSGNVQLNFDFTRSIVTDRKPYNVDTDKLMKQIKNEKDREGLLSLGKNNLGVPVLDITKMASEIVLKNHGVYITKVDQDNTPEHKDKVLLLAIQAHILSVSGQSNPTNKSHLKTGYSEGGKGSVSRAHQRLVFEGMTPAEQPPQDHTFCKARVSPDDRYIAFLSAYDDKMYLTIRDLTNGKEFRVPPPPSEHLHEARDIHHFAWSSKPGQLYVFEYLTRTENKMHTLTLESGREMEFEREHNFALVYPYVVGARTIDQMVEIDAEWLKNFAVSENNFFLLYSGKEQSLIIREYGENLRMRKEYNVPMLLNGEKIPWIIARILPHHGEVWFRSHTTKGDTPISRRRNRTNWLGMVSFREADAQLKLMYSNVLSFLWHTDEKTLAFYTHDDKKRTKTLKLAKRGKLTTPKIIHVQPIKSQSVELPKLIGFDSSGSKLLLSVLGDKDKGHMLYWMPMKY